jgi:hypothetical protein
MERKWKFNFTLPRALSLFGFNRILLERHSNGFLVSEKRKSSPENKEQQSSPAWGTRNSRGVQPREQHESSAWGTTEESSKGNKRGFQPGEQQESPAWGTTGESSLGNTRGVYPG